MKLIPIIQYVFQEKLSVIQDKLSKWCSYIPRSNVRAFTYNVIGIRIPNIFNLFLIYMLLVFLSLNIVCIDLPLDKWIFEIGSLPILREILISSEVSSDWLNIFLNSNSWKCIIYYLWFINNVARKCVGC